jgi:hypothetical protein
MGASTFTMYARGKNLSDAYDRAVENATREYGDDPYNGTVSTTNGVTDVTQSFKRSKKEVYAFIDSEWDRFSKRDCAAICLEEPKTNTNKVKSQVDHIVTSGTKKWVLKYVVRKYNHNDLSSHATKGDAVKAARTYTEKTQEQTTIHMVKVLDKCSDQVAKISYKKSTSEKDGRWLLFGWAAE